MKRKLNLLRLLFRVQTPTRLQNRGFVQKKARKPQGAPASQQARGLADIPLTRAHLTSGPQKPADVCS
jgi:hypothetical protein